MNRFNGLPVRGIHLDLKAQMLKFSAICEIVRDASRWGYNTLVLEYQDKFPFEGDLAVLSAPDALKREEILELTGLCKSLGISIVPLLQCLGHEYWVLRHKRFAHLAEGTHENEEYGREFCPSNPDSLEMYNKMSKQILSLHSDCQYFHLGGDEITLFENCEKCNNAISKTGKGKLLAQYYRGASDLIRSCGPTPVLWSDMLLAYPETLDNLRGRVVIMDWDYWSGREPGSNGLVWGARGLEREPDKWPDAHQRIVRKYIYKIEPYLFNPFPYTRLLKDQGFLSITAPAARCSGDACFVPMNRHMDNCIQAVISAAEANSLGIVITSWAVRRSPWAMTENCLIAASLMFNDPGTPYGRMDDEFCREHFGVTDTELASIPAILSNAATNAMKYTEVLSSAQNYPDIETGHFFADGYEKRLKNKTIIDNRDVVISYIELKHAAKKVTKLLEKARPDTKKADYCTKLWLWAADTAEFFGNYVPLLTQKNIPYAEIEKAREDLLKLRDRNNEILSPILTDFTMISEDQMRVGIHLDHIDKILLNKV